MSEYKTFSTIAHEIGCNPNRIKTICKRLDAKKIFTKCGWKDGYKESDVISIYEALEALPRSLPEGMMQTLTLSYKYGYSGSVVSIIKKDRTMPEPKGYMLSPSNLVEIPYYEEDEFMAWVSEKHPRKQQTAQEKRLNKKTAKPVIKPVEPVKVKYKNPLAFFDIARGV